MDEQRINVLIVEDDEGDVFLIRERLAAYTGPRYRFSTEQADRLAPALERLAAGKVDVVLLDLGLPDSRGLDTLRNVFARAPETPIVVLTGLSEEAAGLEAVKSGAQDYLLKGESDGKALVRSLKYAIERKRAENIISRLEGRNRLLLDELRGKDLLSPIVADTPAMINLLDTVRIVSQADSSVIIYGETGTGKELVANAIHGLSPRQEMPFIKINCAAIPDTLLESELFGYEKGAFTGAVQRRKGKFEAADGGTIFLDEIGDIPLSVQAKLLRVLESRTFERLGGNEPVTSDVRIIYATRKDLALEAREGRFREDLFYRINSVPITLPPLRERREDIPLLTNYFLDLYSGRFGKTGLVIGPEAMATLLKHDYPGNVRELKHAIETVVIMSRDNRIEADALPFGAKGAVEAPFALDYHDRPLAESLKAVEKQIIARLLRETGGKKAEAAERLGISRETLWRKLKEYGLDSLS